MILLGRGDLVERVAKRIAMREVRRTWPGWDWEHVQEWFFFS
jgi:hypothetical protein